MADTLHRLVCDLLGCSYPIVLAGMRWSEVISMPR